MKIGRMLDSGLMACSISETAEMKLREAWVIMDQKKADVNVVYGCGGLRVKQKSAFFFLNTLFISFLSINHTEKQQSTQSTARRDKTRQDKTRQTASPQ